MVVGFNHNIRYKGELFHVQTEDSGLANPHIITLLYLGGTILCSKKTSYADIIRTDQLEQVVESIMKEQHKEMMRRLKGGEFDARLFPCCSSTAQRPAQGPAGQNTDPAAGPHAAQPAGQGAGPNSGPGAGQTRPPSPPATRSLDEVILDYLITGEE